MATTNGICALHRAEAKLVKSHLYPKAFYEFIADEYLAVIPTDPNERRTKSWTGIYDTIVCRDAENIFEKLDDYAAKVLKHDIWDQKHLTKNGETIKDLKGRPCGYELQIKHPQKFLLFLLSILWRFSASKRPEAKNVTLGPLEDEIRILLKSECELLPERYDVIARRFWNFDSVVTPGQLRLDGVITWKFIFGGYEFYLKTDSQKFSTSLNSFSLSHNKHLLVLLCDYEGTSDWKQIANSYRNSYLRDGDPWKGRQ